MCTCSCDLYVVFPLSFLNYSVFSCCVAWYNVCFPQLVQAYRRGMTFPRYLFISGYQYSEFWWTDDIRNVSAYPPPQCSQQELTDAIYRSLAVDYFPMPTAEEANTTTDVGYVSVFTCTHYIVHCYGRCVFICVHAIVLSPDSSHLSS